MSRSQISFRCLRNSLLLSYFLYFIFDLMSSTGPKIISENYYNGLSITANGSKVRFTPKLKPRVHTRSGDKLTDSIMKSCCVFSDRPFSHQISAALQLQPAALAHLRHSDSQ